MGERSQIYVKVDGNLEVANYYQWNYGTRMISRARYGIEWIYDMLKAEYPSAMQRRHFNFEAFRRIWDVNFDYKDMVISRDLIKEDPGYKDDLERFIYGQDNDDGILFVDVNTKTGKIKYCLTDCYEKNPMDAEQYMDWNCGDWKGDGQDTDEDYDTCMQNIQSIGEMAELMTKGELDAFCRKESA